MTHAATVARTPKPEPDWELVLKRNPVERIKREKVPLGIRDELPALIAAGYESVAEEDIVRLQWWGLYHDKPKIGHLHAADEAPERPRHARRSCAAIGEVSDRFGRGYGELATRQNVQLHWIELAPLPEVFAALDARGSRPPAAAATPCATSPAAPCRASTRRALRCVGGRRRGRGVLLRQPRLLRPAAEAQDHDPACPTTATRPRSTASRSSGRSRRARRLRGARRRRALLGAAASRATWASSCRSERGRRVLRAISTPGRRTSATASRGSRRGSSSWSTTSDPRACASASRSGSGTPRGLRAAAGCREPVDHLGVHPQKQAGLVYVGVPVHLGLVGRPDGGRRRPGGRSRRATSASRASQNFIVAERARTSGSTRTLARLARSASR